MYEVSTKFLEVIGGSHRSQVRVQALGVVPQFGLAPSGTELPVIDGDLKLTARTDIKGTVEITVPGDYWDLVQPYGNELFVERGINFGDGSTEMVPLGYYRIESIDQDEAPYGTIRISANDRIAQMQQNRVLSPYPVPPGTTHRAIFERLVNGNAGGGQSTAGNGMYYSTAVPIVWTGYNPDTATVGTGQTVEDSTYEFLAKLADEKNCILRFDREGKLVVESLEVNLANPIYTITPGRVGNLVSATRTVTRSGVYNVVSAYGSDPAHPTGYQYAYHNDVNSPLYWKGKFGPAPRFFSSPLLTTDAAAEAAAATVLARYTGLPQKLGLFTVPNPALQPLDVITAVMANNSEVHVVEEVTIPLAGSQPVSISTRTVNEAPVIETQPNPTPTPPPNPNPPPTPGDPGGNPDDGTQAAVLLNWGTVVDGDEFNYAGSPDSSKWSMYDGEGHSGNGLRRPSAFNVANGILTCTGDNVSGGTTGGMAFKRDERYCRIEIRLRTYSINPSAGGNRYHPVLITWPTSDEWPAGAEYDYFETDCDSGELAWFIHYPNHQPKVQEGGTKPMDIQNWHNYAFEWAPNGLRAWCDGVKYFEYTQSSIQAPGPMHLTYQLDNFFGSNMCPAKMEAMWVRIYAKP